LTGNDIDSVNLLAPVTAPVMADGMALQRAKRRAKRSVMADGVWLMAG
jgi:hypothetical protein